MKSVPVLLSSLALAFAAFAQNHPVQPRASAVTNRPPASVAELIGKDQFGADFRSVAPFGKPLLVTLADQRGATQTGGWVSPLRERFGDGILFLAVADVSAVPTGMREMIRRKFHEKYPRPMLMDWTGDLTRRMNAVRRRCNLYVVAPDGKILAFHSGEADEAALGKVCELLTGLGVKPVSAKER